MQRNTDECKSVSLPLLCLLGSQQFMLTAHCFFLLLAATEAILEWNGAYIFIGQENVHTDTHILATKICLTWFATLPTATLLLLSLSSSRHTRRSLHSSTTAVTLRFIWKSSHFLLSPTFPSPTEQRQSFRSVFQ